MTNRRRLRSTSWLAGAIVLAAATACSRKDDPAPPSATPHVGYGTVMSEVGRRFELLGRALVAGRWELAEYERGEIDEAFTEALPSADPPKEGHPEVLPGQVTAFRATPLPDLEKALASHDPANARAAFARMAASCNGCHQASGHGFIEVPAEPGHAVPNTDTPAH